jgi:cyclic pyranopterin phosphate synthase
VIRDKHGRIINYLRLGVTDRCNMRCLYCMPEEGNQWLSRHDLISYEEMLRLCALLVKSGIEKIRITGGEPFVRKDILYFLQQLSKLEGLNQISITTNGVVTAAVVPVLKSMGIHSINLSLDSLDRERFFSITRRDELPAVLQTMEAVLDHEMELKINCVVMHQRNTEDILPLVELTRHKNISVRFIEEMPFNGEGHAYSGIFWNHRHIVEHISSTYPLQKLPDPLFSTAYRYQVPGYRGTIGIIAAYSRTFCGTCNRLRITPQGMMKTCLYEQGGLNVRDLLRSNITDDTLHQHMMHAIGYKAADGWEADRISRQPFSIHQSMATIGG